METITGTITSVRKDRKGFAIGDEWYSSWDALDVNRGDEVLFNYVQKGRYKNIKGSVKVTGGGAPAPKAGGFKGGNNNLGIELGHAANLAQRVMEVMYCEDQLDAADVEVGGAEYWQKFSEQTLRAYKVMKALRTKVSGGEEEAAPAPEPKLEIKVPAPNPEPTLEEDIF